MPGLAAVVILSLGVGIGVNTAVFSWIQAIVLKPIPGVDDSAQLLSRRAEGRHRHLSGHVVGRVPRPQAAAAVDRRAGRVSHGAAQRRRSRPHRAHVRAAGVGQFLRRARTAAGGRTLHPARRSRAARRANRSSCCPTITGRRISAASPSAIGQTIRVNDNQLTIVGVAPEGFQGTILALQFDLWVPATLAPALFAGSSELESRNQRGYSAMGRLRDGADRGAGARRSSSSAMGELAAAFPESNGRISGELMPYWRAARGPQMMFITALGILQGVMLLVLLAVCGNTANLVLARASTRYREVGVRLALGAGPASVIRLMLAENLLLGLLGAAVGIVIAWWGTEALRAMPPYGAFPVRFQTSLDGLGLAFAVALGIGSGLLFGAAPALAARPRRSAAGPEQRLEIGRPQRDSRWPDGAAVRSRAAGAGRGGPVLPELRRNARHRSGIPHRGTAAGHLRSERHGDRPMNTPRQFATQLLDRLRRVPSVESVALANAMPLDIHGLPLRGFTLEGRAQTTAQQESALSNIVSPGYFTTMGIPIVAGEDFADMAEPIAAAASHRQRGIRAPLRRAGGSARPAAASTATPPTRSPAS